MTDSTGSSALRLTAPLAQAYDTSPGELALLKDMNFNNLGGMYGMLLNQRAIGQGNQDAYRSDLRGVNAQQYQLGQAKLAADELESLRRTGIDLIQHGGVDAGNVAPLQSLMLDRGATAQTDALRRQGSRAKALSDMGSGMNNLSQAGVNLDPGQRVSLDPAELGRLRSTTGDPRSITEQRIQSAGTVAAAGARATAEGAPRVKITEGPLEGDRRVEVTGTNYNAVTNTAGRAVEAQGWRRGGANGTTGPAAGAGGGRAGVVTVDQARQRIADMKLPAGTRPVERGGQFYARLPNGTDQPLR